MISLENSSIKLFEEVIEPERFSGYTTTTSETYNNSTGTTSTFFITASTITPPKTTYIPGQRNIYGRENPSPERYNFLLKLERNAHKMKRLMR